MERSEQNEHVVGNKGDGVDDDVDYSVDDSDDSGNKRLTHLSQAADCCLTERSKQNEHVVGNK
eukprot:10430038-Ditylum_brightwellii.AAC.1